MSHLHPWAYGPFELLLHAEDHYRLAEDFDRRIALISFDNAVEVAITTYLALHPLQRGNRTYSKADVEKWLHGYHTKLDFLEQELKTRGQPWTVERSYIIYAHDHRNEQYHGGSKGTPEKHVLKVIRSAALWIFGVLFDVPDPEKVLDQQMIARRPPPPPQPHKNHDNLINSEYGVINVAGQQYLASELLFAVDENAYRDVAKDLEGKAAKAAGGKP